MVRGGERKGKRKKEKREKKSVGNMSSSGLNNSTVGRLIRVRNIKIFIR